MRVNDMYVFFWGGIYSNWYMVRFLYKGHSFNNTEQAFMWEKAVLFNDNEIAAKILKTSCPKESKSLGRKVKNFNNTQWDDVKENIMFDVNYEKFTQNNRLCEELLSTDNKILVEASPYDKIWGIGLHWEDDRCLDETNWLGENLLGKVLIKVRETIKNK